MIPGGRVEDVVERLPIQLMCVDIRRHRPLESREAYDRIRTQRSKERIDLCRSVHGAASIIDSPVSGELPGIETGELGRYATDLKLGPRCGDRKLARGHIGESVPVARARRATGHYDRTSTVPAPTGATAVMDVGESMAKSDEAFVPK